MVPAAVRSRSLLKILGKQKTSRGYGRSAHRGLDALGGNDGCDSDHAVSVNAAGGNGQGPVSLSDTRRDLQAVLPVPLQELLVILAHPGPVLEDMPTAS